MLSTFFFTSLAFTVVYLWLIWEDRPVRYVFLLVYILTVLVGYLESAYFATVALQIVMIVFIIVWYAGRPDAIGDL